MLADTQWAELEPLIEACRPKGKTPPQDLRRTISAILWRHQNGAKWRAIPTELGALVARGSDLHPLGTSGCLEPALEAGAGAGCATWDDVSRRHQHPRAPEGRGS